MLLVPGSLSAISRIQPALPLVHGAAASLQLSLLPAWLLFKTQPRAKTQLLCSPSTSGMIHAIGRIPQPCQPNANPSLIIHLSNVKLDFSIEPFMAAITLEFPGCPRYKLHGPASLISTRLLI